MPLGIDHSTQLKFSQSDDDAANLSQRSDAQKMRDVEKTPKGFRQTGVAPNGPQGDWFVKHNRKREMHDTTIESIKSRELPHKTKPQKVSSPCQTGAFGNINQKENKTATHLAGTISPNKKRSPNRTPKRGQDYHVHDYKTKTTNDITPSRLAQQLVKITPDMLQDVRHPSNIQVNFVETQIEER